MKTLILVMFFGIQPEPSTPLPSDQSEQQKNNDDGVGDIFSAYWACRIAVIDYCREEYGWWTISYRKCYEKHIGICGTFSWNY